MKHTAKPLLVILLFGLAVRLLYLYFNTQTPYFSAPVLDEFYYYQWANEITAGDLLASASVFRPPTYSYLLAGILKLARRDFFFVVELLQHAGGIAGAVLLFLLALQLFRNRTVAIVSALLAVAYGPALFFEGQLLDTWLQMIFAPLVLIAALSAMRSETKGSWLLLGLAGGLAAIVRPAGLPFFVLLTAFSPWLMRRSFPAEASTTEQRTVRKRFVLIALMWLGIILPIVPLALRNMIVSNSFVPIASYAGINFWIGNNSTADGFTAKTPHRYASYGRYEDSVELFAKRRAEECSGRKLDAAEVQSFWFEQGRAEIVADPIRFFKLCIKKLVLFWNRFEIRNNKNIYVAEQFNPILRWCHTIFSFGLLMPFAFYGLFRFTKREWMNRTVATYLLYVLTLMGGVILFFVNARYRFSAAYLALPWSAYGIVHFAHMLRNRFVRKKLRLHAAVLILAFLMVNANFYGINTSQKLSEDYWTVANCYAHKGMDEEAMQYYWTALFYDPGFSEAFINIGEIYFRREDYRKAAACFQKALTTAGGEKQSLSRAFNNLGTVHAVLGDFDRAVSYYGLAVEVAPANALAWVGLGNAWRKKQQWERAYAAYETAVGLDARMPLAHLGLAHCWARAGDEVKVMEELRRMVRASKDDVIPLLREEPELATYLPKLVE